MHSKIFYRIANKRGYGPYCLDECPKTFEYLDNAGLTLQSDRRPLLNIQNQKFESANSVCLYDWLYLDSEELIYCFSNLGQLIDWFDKDVLSAFEQFGEVLIYKFEVDYPYYYIDKKQSVVKKSVYLKTKRCIVSYSDAFQFVDIKEPAYPMILLNRFSGSKLSLKT